MPLPRLLSRYRRDQNGATAIEYGLMAAMIAAALIGILSTSGATQSMYDVLLAIADAMTEATGGEGADGAEG